MPGLKSSLNNSRGRFCESLAANHFVENLGHIFVTQNLNLYFGEIDLLLISPEGELVVVEVKSVNDELSWRAPVSKSQALRLKRVMDHFVATSPRACRMHLAAVNQQNEIVVFEDFLADMFS
ncbi:MAG: YraN family protein [Bdellovibrionales bacterium]|nr:YraN family protein [Bdellovibrionales bacterium]